MTSYPQPLFDLVNEGYPQEEFSRLVTQAGGDWNEVDATGSGKNRLHNALRLVAGNDRLLLGLRDLLTSEGKMNDDVAIAVDDFIEARVISRLDVPSLSDLARDLMALEGGWSAFASTYEPILTADEKRLTRSYGSDRTRTCRSVLIVAAVADKLPALLAPILADHSILKARYSPRAEVEVARHPPTVDDPGRLDRTRRNVASQPSRQELLVSDRSRNMVDRIVPTKGSGAARPDPDPMKRMELTSAVRVLKDLVVIIDRAIDMMGTSTGGPPPIEGDDLSDYFDYVAVQQSMIDDELGTDEPELTRALECLASLVTIAVAGMRIAEHAKDFLSIKSLADEAARGCRNVLVIAPEGQLAELLARAIPLWEMKAAYAEHRSDVEHRRSLMAARAPGTTLDRAQAIRTASMSLKEGSNRV